jgi:hypothetical protein
MRRKILIVVIVLLATIAIVPLASCEREAELVSYNLSKDADNFNVTRKITFINIRTDTILFQMTGRISIETDSSDNQLEITVKNEDGKFSKHFINLTEWTTYVVEDISSTVVDPYQYQFIFNPKMLVPLDIDYSTDNVLTDEQKNKEASSED